MLHKARKVAEHNFKFLRYWIAGIRVQIGKSWRTRLQPIRTSGEISAHIKILPARQPYLYQKLSQKATQLRLLGMSYGQISRSLHIDRKTATKACEYQGRWANVLAIDHLCSFYRLPYDVKRSCAKQNLDEVKCSYVPAVVRSGLFSQFYFWPVLMIGLHFSNRSKYSL